MNIDYYMKHMDKLNRSDIRVRSAWPASKTITLQLMSDAVATINAFIVSALYKFYTPIIKKMFKEALNKKHLRIVNDNVEKYKALLNNENVSRVYNNGCIEIQVRDNNGSLHIFEFDYNDIKDIIPSYVNIKYLYIDKTIVSEQNISKYINALYMLKSYISAFIISPNAYSYVFKWYNIALTPYKTKNVSSLKDNNTLIYMVLTNNGEYFYNAKLHWIHQYLNFYMRLVYKKRVHNAFEGYIKKYDSYILKELRMLHGVLNEKNKSITYR